MEEQSRFQTEKQTLDRVVEQTGKVIIGKEAVIRKILTAMLAGGHVLLEDVPGTGKTRTAKAIAASLGLQFGRIQFTPDLLPADLTGLQIYNRQKEQFEVRKGPVFTNLLLADEINRATPRTQAGLLECMEEKQVTIDGESWKLEEPFFVIATQNPVETAGTFPLPEAQMDRFLMRLSMGFPEREEEIRMLETYHGSDPLASLQPVMSVSEWIECRKAAESVFVHPLVQGYAVDLAAATRKHPKIQNGVSPRGTLALVRCAKAAAFLAGRDYVIPDDLKTLAPDVFAHRIVTDDMAGMFQGTEALPGLIAGIADRVSVPTEQFDRR